jgi:hypothetical protein
MDSGLPDAIQPGRPIHMTRQASMTDASARHSRRASRVWVLACFDPWWPDLNFAVAQFGCTMVHRRFCGTELPQGHPCQSDSPARCYAAHYWRWSRQRARSPSRPIPILIIRAFPQRGPGKAGFRAAGRYQTMKVLGLKTGPPSRAASQTPAIGWAVAAGGENRGLSSTYLGTREINKTGASTARPAGMAGRPQAISRASRRR